MHGGAGAAGLDPPARGQGLHDGEAATGEVGDAGIHLLGRGQRTAVGDRDVEAGGACVPGDVHGAVGEGTGVTHGVADELADHEAGVVAVVVVGVELAHPLHELLAGDGRALGGERQVQAHGRR